MEGHDEPSAAHIVLSENNSKDKPLGFPHVEHSAKNP
jgi:hypothetical protein